MKAKADKIDKYVGQQLRIRRIFQGLSQEELGKKLGVKFQQIQKYERGQNRLGVANLQKAAQALNVPLSFFFKDLTATREFKEEAKSNSQEILQATSGEGLKLIKYYSRIEDPMVRRKLLEFVKAMAEAQTKKNKK